MRRGAHGKGAGVRRGIAESGRAGAPDGGGAGGAHPCGGGRDARDRVLLADGLRRGLSYEYWKAVADTPGVVAIKCASFNRYQSIDLVRGVAYSARREEIALYTGNDDNIVADLLTPYRFPVDGKEVELRFVGGLLGHWSVWTHSVVKLYEELREYRDGRDIPAELLARGAAVTDCNGVFFDVAHNFAGCIPGVHEVLRRQGLMAGTWCLDPDETLSEGQAREIDRVYEMYPHLNDDAFVALNLKDWMA